MQLATCGDKVRYKNKKVVERARHVVRVEEGDRRDGQSSSFDEEVKERTQTRNRDGQTEGDFAHSSRDSVGEKKLINNLPDW